MNTSLIFFLGVTLAYSFSFVLWLGIDHLKNGWWPDEELVEPDSKYIDLLVMLGVVVGVLGIGQVYSLGFLIPEPNNQYLASLSWVLNNLIIYSPIFIAIYFRKQSLNTVFLSSKGLIVKVGFGLLAAAGATFVYYLFSGSEKAFLSIFSDVVQLERLNKFLAVFFEGVAVAMLFVRLSWAIGKRWAIIIPSVLFSVSHIPKWISEGQPVTTMVPYIIVMSLIPMLFLFTAGKSKDIIWLGIVHFMMNQAILSFG